MFNSFVDYLAAFWIIWGVAIVLMDCVSYWSESRQPGQPLLPYTTMMIVSGILGGPIAAISANNTRLAVRNLPERGEITPWLDAP